MRGESQPSQLKTIRPERSLPPRREKSQRSGGVEVGKEGVESRQEHVLGIFEDVEKLTGHVGFDLLRRMATGEITPKQCAVEMARLPDFSEFQDRAIGFLESLGMVEVIEGNLVVDLDAIIKINSNLLKNGTLTETGKREGKSIHINLGRIDDESNQLRLALKKDFTDYFETSQLDFLFSVFHNKKIISRADWQAWEESDRQGPPPESKDFFYNPSTTKDAFDVNKIRQAKFYLKPWSLPSVKGVGNDGTTVYSKFHPNLDMREVALACTIYHPSLGDGRRNEKGELEVVNLRSVKYGESIKRKALVAGGRVKMNGNWLLYFGPMKRGVDHKGQLYISPALNLANGEMPHLQISDSTGQPLLVAEDFATTSSGEYVQKYNPLKEVVSSTRQSYIFIDSIRYPLGAEFSSKSGKKKEGVKYLAGKISDSLGAIVEKNEEGKERLVRTFKLEDKKDNPKLQYSKTSTSGFYTIKKKDVEYRDFDDADEVFLERREDETDEQFARRKQDYNFSRIFELRKDFVREVGVNLVNLDPEEQMIFLDFYYNSGEERKKKVVDFLKIHRENGLHALLSLRHDEGLVEKVLEVADKLDPAKAGIIFEKFVDIIKKAGNVEEELKTFFVSEEKVVQTDRYRVLGELVSRAGKFMQDMLDEEEGLNDKKLSEIVRDLDGVKEDVIMFATIFKNVFKTREDVANVDLRELNNLERIEDITGEELSKRRDLVEKMKGIIRKQFPGGDDVEFEKEIAGNKDIRLTIALVDGEIVSFFAKKKIGDKLDYVDWFISNPDTEIKGLGEATVKLGFVNDLERGHSYYAVAKPHVKSFPISIESLGFSAFVGSTDDGEYKHHYVRMSRLPEDKNLTAKSITPEQKEKLRQVAQAVCVEPNKMEHVFLYGATFQVCKVEFSEGVGSKDDVKKDDPDGWIMSEIERQYGKGKVLSSFIPRDNSKGNRVFYAVFEEDINRAKREEIRSQLSHAA